MSGDIHNTGRAKATAARWIIISKFQLVAVPFARKYWLA
jgi:hypothetical protein